MADFVPLHLHSHYSLLDGLSQPHQIASRAVECGYNACAITDHGSVSGAAAFVKALKEVCKCGHQKKSHSASCCVKHGCTCKGYEKASVRPILGSEFYLSSKDATIRDVTNRPLTHLCVLAKNLDGWKSLIKASSASNRPEVYYHKPRLDLDRLASFSNGNFLVFSGHVGSDLANVCFGERFREAYSAQTYDLARTFVRPDWKEAVTSLACRYRDLFGKKNFWLEIQIIDQANLPASLVIARILRDVSKRTGIPCVATADSHYARTEDAADQRVLLCSSLETTLGEVQQKAEAGEDVSLGGFFKSSRYHIPSGQEMGVLHTREEMVATVQIAEMCESYDILGKPMLPEFACPNGLTSDQLLEMLCVEGWKGKIAGRIKDGKVYCPGTGASYDESVYRDRLKREFGVIFEAGLSSYFLIVQDFCNYARTKGKVGKGRGSGAGCMASYLSGITDVDPIEYSLIFERFYNAGRNSPGRVALPDIDCDFEKFKREDVISYIRTKYGASKVAQMATFTRMQGRGAIKDVLRAHSHSSNPNAISFEEMNRITESIPGEAEIADHLQEMMEERGEASIIQWALENDPASLKDWCQIGENGVLEGRLSKEFAQAIRMEGTLRSSGKHASGLIISAVDLGEVVPMSFDKSTKEQIVAVDMRDAEAMGLVKFDILGIGTLDRIRGAVSIVKTGKMDG